MVSATAIVIRYPEAPLTKSQELIVNGDFSIAVVVAHMACEISVERAISRAFAEKGIGYLEESVEEFYSSRGRASSGSMIGMPSRIG